MSAKPLRTKLVEFCGHQPLLRPFWRMTRDLLVVERSPFVNIYHCCTQKTASQWFRAVFSDPVMIRHTGLDPEPYVALGLRQARIEEPLPPRTVGVHLYIDHPTYAALPKAEPYRSFYVLRDPRDLVVSWYFSARFSHARNPTVLEMRAALEKLDEKEGLKYIIDKIAEFGTFEAQLSWVEAPPDPHVRIFRYEDLAADNAAFLARLLDWLEIHLRPDEFEGLARRNSFERLSHGRKQGEEATRSHYRKGVAGDWKNHFDAEIAAHFRAVTGDLVERLGYAEEAPRTVAAGS